MKRLAAAAAIALLLQGCGHSTKPRNGYDDPSKIPLAEDVAVYPSARAVDVTWFADDAIFEIILGWNIYRAVGIAIPEEAAWIRLNDEIYVEREFTDQDVADGETYRYRLTSVTPANIESVPTQPVAVRVDFTPPEPPRNLRATVEQAGGSTFVRLEWDPVDDPELLHYNVLRDPPDPLVPVISGLVVTHYTDFEVDAGATYTYVATAVDRSLNESGPSNQAEAVLP